MSWLLGLAITTVLAAGVFLALSRSVLRIAIGISLIGSAINLLLFASGRLGGAPPVIELGRATLEGGANPLPQALVLTAIVIGFALTCFSLVLALVVRQTHGTADADELREAEPRPAADGKPQPMREDERDLVGELAP